MRHVKTATGGFVASLLTGTVLLAACTSSPATSASDLSREPPVRGEQPGSTAPRTPAPAAPDGETHPLGPASGDSPDGKPGPYAAEIKSAAKKADSQFARDVLKDGVITRAEYLEAMNRYKSCMEDHGITVKFIDHNGYYTIETISQSSDTGHIDTACEKGTIRYIGGLYPKTITNPNNDSDSIESRVYACLKRNGLIPDGYTEQEYANDVNAHAVTVEVDENGPVSSVPPVPPPTFPYFDAMNPIRIACMNNPQNPKIQPSTTG